MIADAVKRDHDVQLVSEAPVERVLHTVGWRVVNDDLANGPPAMWLSRMDSSHPTAHALVDGVWTRPTEICRRFASAMRVERRTDATVAARQPPIVGTGGA